MKQKTADNGRGQRAQALIARMKKARGYIYPEWEFAAQQDPEFVEAYNKLYELVLSEGRHVSVKEREYHAIALLPCRRAMKFRLGEHIERVIPHAATREEPYEVPP